MKKIVFALIIIALLFGLYRLTSVKPSVQGVSDSAADLILYWGQGCPHCEKVKQFITANKLDQKIKISQKEVYNNQANQQEMLDKAKLCPEIDTTQGMGVPFAFIPSTKKCLQGDQPIIDWLSAK